MPSDLNAVRQRRAKFQRQLCDNPPRSRFRAVRLLRRLLSRVPGQRVVREWLRTALGLAPSTEPETVPSTAPSEDQPTPSILDRPSNHHLTRKQADRIAERMSDSPTISLLVRASRGVNRGMFRTLASISNQFYPNWELLIVDPHSDQFEFRANSNGRVRLCPDFGEALRLAKGDWIGIVDSGDELTLDALTWVASRIEADPRVRWLYTDQDYCDADGNVLATHYKPDFSLELLLSTDFVDRFSVVAKLELAAIGECRSDHDFALRLSERLDASRIAHIPRVLHHRRSMTEACHSDETGIAERTSIVEDALRRRGLDAVVSTHPKKNDLYLFDWAPDERSSVTVVIPTHNGLADLKTCIRSMREKTKHTNYDIVVVDNRSTDPALADYLAKEKQKGTLRVVEYDAPFDHSAMNNLVGLEVDTEFLVLANNDVEILSSGWLEQMLATFRLDSKIAAVGGLLFYPDGTIQHSGVLLGFEEGAEHAHVGYPGGLPGYFGRAHALQEFSCVTAALMAVRRSAFAEVAGFRPERYPTTYNDVDLCLRLRRAGYRCIYNPRVHAVHFESKTRSRDESRDRVYLKRLREDWLVELTNDPFFHPALSLRSTWFQSSRPDPVTLEFEDLSDEPTRPRLRRSA